MKPRAKQLQTESETGTCLDLTTVHLRRCVLCKPDSGTLKTTWEQKDGISAMLWDALHATLPTIGFAQM